MPSVRHNHSQRAMSCTVPLRFSHQQVTVALAPSVQQIDCGVPVGLCISISLFTPWRPLKRFASGDSELKRALLAVSQIAEWVLEKTKLLIWLLSRLRPREFDSNKQYTSELLAILIQSSLKNQQRVADLNGIDALLQVFHTSILFTLCSD